jgi:hypothetical protein
MRAKKISRIREQGAAALVAIIFIGFAALTILVATAAQSRKNLRGVDQYRNKLDEKWDARSNANMLAQKVQIDAPKLFKQHLLLARETCRLPESLIIFDEIGSGAQSLSQVSRPAAKFESGRLYCTRESEPTSVFGDVAAWVNDAKVTLLQEAVERFGFNAATTDIVEMSEIYRRRLDDDPAKTAYAVRYIVESKSGNYRTRTNGEYVLAADDSAISCSTSVSLEANPSRIIRGSTTTLQATYSAANRIQFFNSADLPIHDENVTMQTDPAVVNYTFSPAITDSYYVVATGPGGCSAQSAPVTVIVDDPPPVCPTISLFEASATSVSPGQSVTIRWDVADAFEVTLQQDAGGAAPVSASGSQDFVINSDTTFTLRARDSGNTCPIVRTITIRVSAAPPCQTPPVIDSFSANPASAAPGATVQLSWAVSGIAAGDEVGITGPNGFSQAGLAAGGNLNVTVPNADGDYTYTLTATNICPDGTRQTVQQSIIVRVRTCPPPLIGAFTANPSVVNQGGSQIVRLSWSISGTADSVAINNGVGGGLPSSGFVDITQPQTTTTYTITAIGCGQTKQMQVTVNVTSCPIPVINNFSANPPVVTQGGNENVTLWWSVTGQIDSQSIDRGIGTVSGTSVSILQPQSPTTYTYTVTGCGETRQAQTFVNVAALPPEYSCPFWQESNTVCTVVIGGNCTTNDVSGSLDVSGNVVTGSYTVNPGYSFGQGYLESHAFTVYDSAGRQLATGAIGYSPMGEPLAMGSNPAGAITGYTQNTATWTANILPGAPDNKIFVNVELYYGIATGNISFNFSSQNGGCN